MTPSDPAVSPCSRRDWLKATAGGLAAAAFSRSAACAAEEPTVSGDSQQPLIDCHLHIHHPQRPIEKTIQHMDATGTTQAFMLPVPAEGGLKLTAESVLYAWQQYPDRVIPFCQTDLRQSDFLERVRAYHLLGCRGVGEQKQQIPFGDKRVEALIALCDEFDWPITFHFQEGEKGFHQGIADHLEDYLKRFPRVRIIGHAFAFWAHLIADPQSSKGPVKPGGLLDKWLSDYPHLYADLSAQSAYNALTRDEEFTAGFLERYSRQILFGSDCFCLDGRGSGLKPPGICFNTRLQELLRRLISDEQRLADVFQRNALRALGGA